MTEDLKNILKQKQALIDARRLALEGAVTAAEKRLLKDIVDMLIRKLKVRDGVIVSDVENQRVLDALNELYITFQKSAMLPIAESMAATFADIGEANVEYFATLMKDGIGITKRQAKLFSSATVKAKDVISASAGMTVKGKIIKGGFLDRFVTDTSVRNKIQQFTVRAVTGGMDLGSFTDQLTELVTGAEGKGGVLANYAKTYAYDTYQEYDAAMSAKVADALGLRAFLYQGGLIGDSREFCQDHNGYVYTTEEAKEWRDWTPATAEHKQFPDAKNPSAVPSYIARYPGYSPLVNRGGFNCRHSLNWISNEEAIRRRPELADKLEDV